MAWEEENIEGAEFEEVGGKKNRLKLILIIAGGIVLLCAIGFGVWALFLRGDGKTKAEEVVENTEKTEEAKTQTQNTQAPETGFKVDLSTFTVNLADEDEDRFMRAKIVLEVSTQELQAALTDEADAKLYMVKSRDLILEVLRSKTASDMSDGANIREMRKEIATRMNSIFREGKVMEVYITDLVVQ